MSSTYLMIIMQQEILFRPSVVRVTDPPRHVLNVYNICAFFGTLPFLHNPPMTWLQYVQIQSDTRWNTQQKINRKNRKRRKHAQQQSWTASMFASTFLMRRSRDIPALARCPMKTSTPSIYSAGPRFPLGIGNMVCKTGFPLYRQRDRLPIECGKWTFGSGGGLVSSQ